MLVNRRNPMRIGLLGVAVICLAISAAAQKPMSTPKVPMPEAAAPSSGPITLNVAVTDKAGHPIRGLQKSDFSLLDDRQPTEIRSFAANDASAPNAPPVGVFFVIDEVNTGFDAVSIEREQIEDFLHRDGGHLPVPMALFVLSDDGLTQLTSVSTDGNSLADVLHKKNGELRALGRAGGFYGGTDRFDVSLRGLSMLSNYLARARGRKLVVWISPGWWTFDNPNVIVSDKQQRTFFSLGVAYTAALQNAGITLYAVDPRGTNDAGSLYEFIWQSYLKPVRRPGQAQPGDLALQVMAQHSGGRVLLGSNDVAGEIATCTNDASAWYTITFDPSRADKADTWHDLQVKVDKPEVTVRTQSGYYAQPQISGDALQR
jgi:VWFA-related protein